MSQATHEQLRPIALYEALYTSEQRAFAIPDTDDSATWEQWRAAFRARLHERLGGFPTQPPPPAVIYAATPTTHDGYQRSYIEFESAPGQIVPAWLLIPDGLSGPAPAVIVAHGHGYGADATVGIGAGGSERAEPDDYHQHLAVALCQRGMVVIAPELRGFGRRREQTAKDQAHTASSCHEAAWWGLLLGKPLLGTRVFDTIRALDLLQSLPEVDPQRIGIMGGSGGGMVALFTAALDQRLRAAVISNYFCTFRASILAIDHCHCNYVPGLLQDAEMYDIAALLAPRPLMIVSGDADPIFPLPGVLEAYSHTQRAYTTLGVADRIDKHIFAGAHQINGTRAYDFLERWLGNAE